MRRVIFLAALAVAVTGLLFGLGIGRGGQSAQAAVSHAAQRTLDTGSSRFSMTYAGTGVPSAAAGRPFLEGELDYRTHVGVLQMNPSGVGGEQVILDGDAMYLKLQGMGRSWVRFDSPLQMAVFEPQFQALRDPAALLEFLRAGSSDVHQDGSETIGGVPTSRYGGTLDLNRVVAQAPADKRELLRKQLALIGQFQSTSIPYTIWVDEHDVARRLRFQDTSTDTDVPGGQRTSTTIDFYDFGISVHPAIPAAADVLTTEEFQRRMGAETTSSGSGSSASATATVTFENTSTNGGR